MKNMKSLAVTAAQASNVSIQLGSLADKTAYDGYAGLLWYEPSIEKQVLAADKTKIPVPTSITAAQARKYLITVGKTAADVESALATLPSPQRDFALADWEYEPTYQRANAMWDAIGPNLGIDIDAAFRAASLL